MAKQTIIKCITWWPSPGPTHIIKARLYRLKYFKIKSWLQIQYFSKLIMTQFKGFQNGNPINCIFKAFQYISIAKRLVLTRYCDTLNALNILEAQLPEAKFNANENQHEIIKIMEFEAFLGLSSLDD